MNEPARPSGVELDAPIRRSARSGDGSHWIKPAPSTTNALRHRESDLPTNFGHCSRKRVVYLLAGARIEVAEFRGAPEPVKRELHHLNV